ncbi:TetR/AcrR family transcriptional regulator [Herbiconiux sp. CPCC 203407]|uniref:TetR/AcrR family transcriptional regulator n=1 Tax=Herbiconiux oxytropis TaxID=2970915 RepID=A0AA41XEJ3_9MICO|nr:TetR/AcrR family transcriptional regulator [Herbiconiux oxytropis]MCS5723440.1 TetR/AcrR family transcriptional regulator [Herbiconiux oxytropis]MCS5726527.1 TetR/AcrR family transcriptional regulator [Herbiconiux oxytropis]
MNSPQDLDLEGATAPRPAGRPRDPDVERSILTATQDLLIESGFPGTTIAAVAARARCGKSAIYRRWETKTELVVAAVLHLQTPMELPDTGDLRGDLLAAAMHFGGSDSRSGAVLASVLGELGKDAELRAAAYRSIGGPPVAALVAVIERWIGRGVVPPDVPVDLIANIVPTAAFGSVTLRRRSLEPETVAQLVDLVLLPALRTTNAAARDETGS